MALFYEMLNQVQHDTGKRNLFLKKQINIKNSNKISGAFENVRPIWTAVFRHLRLEFGACLGFGNCDLGFWTLCALRYGNSRQGCESNGVKVPCRQLPDSDG